VAKRATPSLETLGLGAVVCFFDTLGIGSFAPTTAWLKFRHLTPDRLIPPTILVGLTVGAVLESIIFLLQLGVKVDPVLLVGCVVACTTGGAAAWLGASAGIRHINTGNLDLRVVIGLTIGGIPAVFVAAYLVVTMPLELLRWLVLIVVLYAAVLMARAAWHGRKLHHAEG